MEMNHRYEKISGVPTLIVYKDSMEKAAEKGTILFFHGLHSDKKGPAKEILSLAENGYLAISSDNWGHGDRMVPDFRERFDSNNPEFEKNFLEAVERTAYDASIMTDELIRSIADKNKIGITGISMGAYITYKIMSQDNRFKAGCPISGCPIWHGHTGSPHLNIGRFAPAALLIQHGKNDRLVPSIPDKAFRELLRPYYAEYPHRLEYIEFDGEDHIFSEYNWKYLWNNVISWFKCFIK